MCTRRSPGRRRLAALTVSVVALLAGIPSASAERLAVLEIKGADLEPKALAYLSRRVRGEALKHLPAGWEVMTRDNMLVLIDAAQGQCVKEGECEVETGRHIGADVVVAGEVVRLAGRLRLTLHAYETRGGAAPPDGRGRRGRPRGPGRGAAHGV